jgi:DNA-binding XRE family transcriptional regulator
MKERIRQVMESQHMAQQVFANFIGIAPATLSGIFNDRTKPTINIIEAIKKKIPSVSTDWLMFGTGSMYINLNDVAPSVSSTASVPPVKPVSSGSSVVQETLLDFDAPVSPTPQQSGRPSVYPAGGRSVRPDMEIEIMKNIDKAPRRVTEIRVFYDDQTWESFVPAKK